MLNVDRCAENATGEAIVNSMLQAESSNTVLQVDMGGGEGQCSQDLCWAIQWVGMGDSGARSSAGSFSQVYS